MLHDPLTGHRRVGGQLGGRVPALLDEPFQQLPAGGIGQHTEQLVERLPTSGAHARTSATVSMHNTNSIRRRSQPVAEPRARCCEETRLPRRRLDDRQTAAPAVVALVGAMAATTSSTIDDSPGRSDGHHAKPHSVRQAPPSGSRPAARRHPRRPRCPGAMSSTTTSVASVSHSAHRSPSETNCHNSSERHIELEIAGDDDRFICAVVSWRLRHGPNNTATHWLHIGELPVPMCNSISCT